MEKADVFGRRYARPARGSRPDPFTCLPRDLAGDGLTGGNQ